jgi:hypothetical protein
MTTNNTSVLRADTELTNFIPEIWANKALGYLPKYLNLINTVTVDFNADEIKRYGDTIKIPKRGTLKANNKVQGSNVTKQTPTDDLVSITLSNHKEVTFSPEDVARAFSKPDVIEGYMEDAAMKIAESVEDSLAALYVSAGTDVNGGSAVELADLRSGRRALITNKVPKNAPLYAYIDEYAMEDLPLTDASVLGTAAPIVEGSIARLGGFNIFESQSVVSEGSPLTYHTMLYAKDAMGLAVRPLPMDAEQFGGARQAVVNDPQTGLSIRVTMSYDANALAPQITLDCLWGTGILRAEHLVDLYHTNA